MATVLELAQHAGVSTEAVLRVLLSEPVNEEAEKRIVAAIDELGMPEYPRPNGDIEVLPADETPATTPAVLGNGDAAAELVAELRGVFRELLDRNDRERRERIEDVALMSDLVIEGWRNLDRRLGRLEKIFERLNRVDYFENGRSGNGRPRERRLEDWLRAD